MAKKQQDVALKYMIELGVSPARDLNGVFNRIEEGFGKEKAQELRKAYVAWTIAIDRHEELTEPWNELQKLRDQDPELAIAYTGACEGDILRRECVWIHQSKDVFGKEILFAGNDRGITAGFLARELPDSDVTLLCQTEEMAAAARALMEKIRVANVTVVLKDELQGKKFDTVVSGDTAVSHAGAELEDLDYMFIREQGLMRKDAYVVWAETLAGYLKDGGLLISMEVMDRGRDYLGWCFALNQNNLELDPESHAEIPVFDHEGMLNLQILKLKKGSRKEEIDVLAFFSNTYANVLRIDIPKYMDVAAEVMVQICAKELLWGYVISNMNNDKIGKIALYSSHVDDTEMFYYQAMKGNPIEVYRYPYDEKEIIMDRLEHDAREAAQQGWRLSKIMFDMNGNEIMIN